MPRTNEQIAADDRLSAAIEETMRAYFPESGPCVLTDFVVVCGIQELEDGEYISSTINLFREGTMAGWKALGLLEQAKIHLTKD